jgi:N-acetylmuramoyl-L-alanine amidase
MFRKIIFPLLLLGLFSLTRATTIELGDEEYNLKTKDIEGIEYISLKELADTFQGEVIFDEITKQGIWKPGSHQFRFTLFNPYFLFDQKSFNLVYPVEFKEGNFFIPLKTIAPFLEKIPLPQKKSPEKQALGKKAKFDILGINAQEKTNGILIRVFLKKALKYDIFANENRWLNINFYGAKIDLPYFNQRGLSGIIREMKAYQFSTSAQLTLYLDKPFNKFTDFFNADDSEIQISLEDTTQASQSLSPADDPPAETSANTPNPTKIVDNPIDVIIIDPGHGGSETGAIGPTRLNEKDITLDIAKRLKSLLEKQAGVKVILTRESDHNLTLEERSRIANQNGGDIFVSIHTNANKKRTPNGSQTFFLAEAKNDEARAVAALENASLNLEHKGENNSDITDLDFILSDMLQTEFLKESSDLAELVQSELKSGLSISSRGVDQAGFFVLNKTYMPAILIESAFISNRTEEKLLKKESFRQKIAEAIFEGVIKFKEKYKKIEKPE